MHYSAGRVLLVDYANYYVTLQDGSKRYLASHLSFVRDLERFAGKPLYVTDLDEDLANRYLAAIRDINAPATRSWKRKAFLRLWRHAATNPALKQPGGLKSGAEAAPGASNPALKQRPEPPAIDLVTKVKVPGRAPKAWTADQVRQLLATADKLGGHYGWQRPEGPLVVRRLYWRSYILAAWSLGWRRCDLFALEYGWIPPHGRLAITQVKTGKVLTAELSDQALLAVREFWRYGTIDRKRMVPTDPQRRRVWPELGNLATWQKLAAYLVRRAGLPGSIGRLRHSAGTNVELREPGRGHHFLGNTPAVFYSRYFDRTLAEDLPRPETLEP